MSRRAAIERRAARAFHLKDYARAQRHLEDLLALVGENPRTRHALALCCERRGLLDQALEQARRCHALTPNDADNLRLMARLQIALGTPDAARGYVEHALQLITGQTRGGWWARLRDRLNRTHATEVEWCRWAREFLSAPGTRGAPGNDRR